MTEQSYSEVTQTQPEGPTLEPAGLDGNAAVTNAQLPNNNPSPTVIPAEASNNSLHEHLFKLKILETKHTKVDHHLTFLTEAISNKLIPTGLAWNINVNVMEANTTINEQIQKHITESVIGLMELIREHYDTVEVSLADQIQTTQNTIDNFKNETNAATIQKATSDLQQQKEELSNKLKQKRTRKLNNFKSPRQRRQPPFRAVNNTQHLNYITRTQQPVSYQQQYPPDQPQTRLYPDPRPPPRPLMRDPDPYPRDPRIHRYTPPPPSQPRREPPENNVGAIVNTFGIFLQNLQQQTNHLLSSLHQLNSLPMRY